jgi:hypothetical protein
MNEYIRSVYQGLLHRQRVGFLPVSSPIFSPHDVLRPLAFGVMFYLISLPVGIALGIPSLYLIARLRLLAWWSVVFTGLIAEY